MPKVQKGFIKPNTIKDYITTVIKMRSSEGAINELAAALDDTVVTIIATAQELAQAAKRTTIMEQDITAAIEKHIGKKHLSYEELSAEIILQNPADLGKISKAINDYIDKAQRKQ
jgi:histone H3/H4